MTAYQEYTGEQLREELVLLQKEYTAFKARGLKLNMARGKPAPEQLDLSMGLLDTVPASINPALLKSGTADDLRNYGGLTGLPEARELMASILGVPAANTVVLGNSSLNVMYDTVSRAMTHGVLGSTPWARLEQVKFLCPVPGYDRHFAVTEHFGIKMIPVPLTPDGPQMSIVERYVNTDPLVKGIWCVPKYANPTGITYSDRTVERLGGLNPAAPDFRIYWDNAYAVHDLTDKGDHLASLASSCAAQGNSDGWYMFASTSKITFAGAGISALASSEANLEEIRRHLGFQTIGPNKIDQLRHVLFLGDLDGVRAHMRKHAALIAPKFKIVGATLDEGLGGLGIGEWTRPRGGYFISFMGLDGTAARIVRLAKEAGVILTGAGATYPYGKDSHDANIRIAPTYPSVEDLSQASQLFVICVKIASIEVLLEK
jgi:DNA-binding transcriptional MocR family regulator